MQQPISEHSWIERVTESLTLRLFALLPFEMYYRDLKQGTKLQTQKSLQCYNTIQCGK